MPSNHFDEGIIISEGGLTLPLAEWGNYYWLNVTRTHAIPHAQFLKEFPKVSEALAEADRKLNEEKAAQAKLTALMSDPRIVAVLPDIVAHLAQGGNVVLEAFPPAGSPPMQAQPMPPAQGAAPVPGAPPPAVPGQAAADMHTHQMQADEQGNGQTDAGADGHVHPVRGNQVIAQNGHTHDAAQMAVQPPAQPAAQPVAQPPAYVAPQAQR